jgi:hypothetical protein
MGPIALQGPHQGAQKSTITGLSACNTSASKFPSSISMIPSAMIFHPFLVEIKQLFNNSGMRLYCQPRPIFRQPTVSATPGLLLRAGLFVTHGLYDFLKLETVIIEGGAGVK